MTPGLLAVLLPVLLAVLRTLLQSVADLLTQSLSVVSLAVHRLVAGFPPQSSPGQGSEGLGAALGGTNLSRLAKPTIEVYNMKMCLILDQVTQL